MAAVPHLTGILEILDSICAESPDSRARIGAGQATLLVYAAQTELSEALWKLSSAERTVKALRAVEVQRKTKQKKTKQP